MSILEKVDLGHIAAEQDDLQRFFMETEAYQAIVNDANNFLVIGRKGSGKTAIYFALKDQLPQKEKNVVVEALTLHNYPWEKHKEIQESGLPNDLAYINSWKYVIWVVLAKKLLSYQEPKRLPLVDVPFWQRQIDANRRFLHRFLTSNYGSVAPHFTEILADRARNIRSITLDKVAFSTEPSAPPSKSLSESINIINQEVEARIWSILSRQTAYYLLFDQLDLGWDNTPETKQLFIGLILAARDIVRKAQKRGLRVHVVAFLRSDLYEPLRFEDKNKISENVIHLRWNKVRLKALVNKRLQESANAAWEDVFEEENGEAEQLLEFIVERTLLRPRDMIRYCKMALEVARSLGKTRIDVESVLEAESQYSSDHMRREFQDETQVTLPEIDALFDLLSQIGVRRFRREEFEEVFRKHHLAKKLKPEKALNALLELSILGVYVIGGRGGGSRNVYNYELETWDKLPAADRLVVHPSLRETLRLS
jgi:hypothetical protein